MKKKFFRWIAVTLACVMSLGLFTACSDSGSDSDSMTVGVVLWSTDDGLGADAKKAIDFAAEALGMSMLYRTGSYDAENQITDVENLIAAGVDAILIAPMVDTSTDELLMLCEDAGIPMQICFRSIEDETAYDYCMASDYFAGYVVEDEAGAGADMVDALAAAGCTTFGLLNREAGQSTCDNRQAGVADRLDELGLTYYISTNSNTATSTDMVNATDQLVAAYSDIDALILSSGSNGAVDAIITDLEGTDILLTSFDTPADVASSFNAGNVAMLTTGSQIDPYFAMINLYRFLQDDPFSDTPTEIHSNYIYLESVEDVTTYDEYFSEFMTYTAEETLELTELDYDAFLEEVENYSLDYVVNKLS